MTPRTPPVFTFDQLQAWSGGTWDIPSPGSRPPHVRGVTQDTRNLAPGALYCALRGAQYDGHDYVSQAAASGAAAALVAGDWPRPDGLGLPLLRVPDPLRGLQDLARGWRMECRETFFVGITGSAGKTTTRSLVQALLAGIGPTGGTPGNLNNHVGLPLSLLAMPAGMRFGVFEIGMNHPGELKPLCDILRPSAGIITNIGPVHLEFFESVQAIADEKAELLRALPADGFAVLDFASPHYEFIRSQLSCECVSVCLNPAKVAGAEPAKITVMGASRPPNIIKVRGVPDTVMSPLPGRHGSLNLLLAAALAHRLGLAWGDMNEALKAFQLPEMRGQSLHTRGRWVVNDAYNANPLSMRCTLDAFAQQVSTWPGRRVVVLGDMRELGPAAEELHREVGKHLATNGINPALLVTVGRAADWIAGGYHDAGGNAEILRYADSTTAAREVMDWTREGDAILLKGSRGVALERVVEAFG